MTLLRIVLLAIATAVVSHVFYRFDMREAHNAWAALAAQDDAAETFDPAMIADLPEPARRYLTYSIAPGTPLRTTVELRMEGTFALGDRENHRVLPMSARQVLSPPHSFVWVPDIGSGLMRIWGSDGYVRGEAWTLFWVWGLIPVARASGTGDLALSAAARSIMEAIWAPASLLPQNGARWDATGDDVAQVNLEIEGHELTMKLTLAQDGRPLT